MPVRQGEIVNTVAGRWQYLGDREDGSYGCGDPRTSLNGTPDCHRCWTAIIVDDYTGDDSGYDEEEELESAHIPAVYDYHQTNPLTVHNWPKETKKTELCFGVELEMEHKTSDYTDGQEELSTALGGRNGGAVSGSYILMRDGSLNDSGVELITSPYTLDYHQE